MKTSNWRSNFEERPWYSKSYELISDKKNAKILELGSGLGEFAQKILINNNDITCLDIDEGYVANLRKNGFKADKADFNTSLKFNDSQFDGVVTLEVIEHLVNAEFFLCEIKRVLKKGGWLLISTPNVSWFGYRLRFLLGGIPPKEGYHFRFFNFNFLKRELCEKGFKIIKEASISPLPFSRLLFNNPIWFKPMFLKNLLAQDIIFLCKKL